MGWRNLFKPWTFPGNAKKKLGEWFGDSPEEQARKQSEAQGAEAGRQFQAVGRDNFGSLGIEAYDQREALKRRMSGQDSLSREQLRQGLQQQLAQQRSMAAGANPANAAMAARTAAMNMGRASSGMSGQAAMAGLAERRDAENQLTGMIMGQRDQELRAAQGVPTPTTPDKSWLEKYGPTIAAGAAMVASDRDLKTDIKDGDAKSARILAGLKAHSYKYKDDKYGKGEQFGLMAQDMEKSGLGHAVIDTPDGKMVDGGKAALSSLALSAALARRVSKLEKKGE